MRRIVVDPTLRRARVQGGANWGELDRATQEHGLATTGGRVTSTGVAGFTLGSGSGWLERLHGLACDNLVSAELVTADGSTLTAERQRERGAVLGPARRRRQLRHRDRVRVRVAPGRPLAAGRTDSARARQGSRGSCAFIETSSRRHRSRSAALWFSCTLRQRRSFPRSCAGGRGRDHRGVLWLAGTRRGRARAAPCVWLALARPRAAHALPRVAVAARRRQSEGARNYWRSENLGGLPDEALTALIASAAVATSPLSVLILQPLGGAVAAVAEDATPARRPQRTLAIPLLRRVEPRLTTRGTSVGCGLPSKRCGRGLRGAPGAQFHQRSERRAHPRRVRPRQIPKARGPERQVRFRRTISHESERATDHLDAFFSGVKPLEPRIARGH